MLSLVAPINDRSYGIASVNILSELSKRVKTALFYLPPISCEQKHIPTVQNALAASEFYSAEWPSIRLFHQNALAEHPSKKLRIGFPIFELDEFNPVEKNHLSQQDALFVCSHWAKQVVGDIRPTYVVPLGVDREFFHEGVVPRSTNPDVTRFYHVGKIEIRKGHDHLIECFKKAFTREDRVELYVWFHNPFLDKEEVESWVRLYKEHELGDKVFLMNWEQSTENFASLLASMDCGVFPSLAEGWNLPALECLSLGKMLITTYYSGQTEFVNADNSLLIQFDTKEVAYDGMWFKSGIGKWGKWTANQDEQLISQFRKAHEAKQSIGNMLNTGGIKTAQQYSWANSAEKILSNLEQLGG